MGMKITTLLTLENRRKREPLPPFERLSLLKEKPYALLFTVTVLLFALLSFPFTLLSLSSNDIIPGTIAEYPIKAKRNFLFEDHALTLEKRNKALANLLPLFDINGEKRIQVQENIRRAFQEIHAAYRKVLPDYDTYTYLDDEMDMMLFSQQKKRVKNIPEKDKALEQFEESKEFPLLVEEFQKNLGINLSKKTIKNLKWHHFNKRIQEVMSSVVDTVYRKGVVSSKEAMRTEYPRGFILRNAETGHEEIRSSPNSFFSKTDFTSQIKPFIDERIGDNNRYLKIAIAKMLDKLIQPDITFNKVETEARKEKRRKEIPPVIISIRKGQMIVREGEIITPTHIEKIAAMQGGERDRRILNYGIGYLCFAFLFVTALFSYVARFIPKEKKDFQHLLLFCLFYLFSFALLRGVYALGYSIYEGSGSFGQNIALELLPVGVLTILMSVFFTKSSIMMATLSLIFYSLLFFENNPLFILLSLSAGFITFLKVHQFTRKTSIHHLGLLIGCTNALFLICYDIVFAHDASTVLYDAFAGFSGGILSSLIIVALIPVIESLFHTTSDIKLLELTDFNHPLLREMVLKAPGTYHHSLMVGNLSEEAAKAIGANHLLARVGAYFHDIGKIDKPLYFIENLRGEQNRHDNLTPTMSALIIKGHIKGGVEIARKYKLLPVIQDFIREHHGTGRISFFYEKSAKQESEDTMRALEDSFRYEGPVPQSKETAIVAMADTLEAASRTLKEPTRSNITELVNRLVKAKQDDGQLSEAPLTFRELAKIKESFINTLENMHHSRIEYPEPQTPVKKEHEKQTGKMEHLHQHQRDKAKKKTDQSQRLTLKNSKDSSASWKNGTDYSKL